MEVIASFEESDTRDELGIGTIRDGIADLLFPGTGTVQSRARYFLFIPWMYRALENKRTASREVREKARQGEIGLIEALEAGGERKGGIIGIDARQNLQRLPSNIYWQGLGTWGIRVYQGSQDQYHRSLDSWYQAAAERINADRGELFDDGTVRPNWHPGIPEAPTGWRDKVDFSLRKSEARFLRDCILNHCAGSLLAYLLDADGTLGEADFIWASEVSRKLSPLHREQVNHARNFSETMHGAAVLYNLMLASKASKSELRNQYAEQMQDWAALIKSRKRELSEWNRGSFWSLISSQGIRVSIRTREFVDTWLDFVLSGEDPALLAGKATVRDLIKQREVTLKRGLARLDNQRALELWNEAAGLGRLNFRWHVARRMVNDILEGLGHA